MNSSIVDFPYFRQYPGEVTDSHNRQCRYAGSENGGWVVDVDGTDEPCIKTIGFYQWIPFVLLIQVINPPLIK